MGKNPSSSRWDSLAVDVAGASKSFGATPALREVDLQLGWGRMLALFGHNGAGKSTLLRMLATLVRSEGGGVRVAGFDLARHAAQVRALIGYVGHQSLLYDDLTPAENLAFYARLYRVADAPRRIRELLGQVGAEGWADRRVRTLSNGMQKRVAIARALLHRPPVLLLDEPETGLDSEGLALLERIVRGVVEGGASVVMSTHSIERGLALAGQVLVLAAGRVTLAGDALHLGPAHVQSALARQTEVA